MMCCPTLRQTAVIKNLQVLTLNLVTLEISFDSRLYTLKVFYVILTELRHQEPKHLFQNPALLAQT